MVQLNLFWLFPLLFVAVMQTPTPHAITTITVSTSGQDGENTKWIAFRLNYVPPPTQPKNID